MGASEVVSKLLNNQTSSPSKNKETSSKTASKSYQERAAYIVAAIKLQYNLRKIKTLKDKGGLC